MSSISSSTRLSSSDSGPMVPNANLDSTTEPSSSRGVTARRQGVFWLCTFPFSPENSNPDWTTSLPAGISWIRGQREVGETSGYEHWQFLVAFSKKVSIGKLQEVFGRGGHYELSRSEAAAEYVWKEATRVEGSQFELGARPFRRNSRTDWDQVWKDAQSGRLESIPANVRVVSYRFILINSRTLRSIASDYDQPGSIIRTCFVFWGVSGTGKSRRAWDEAGLDAYPKDPRTKFWCGYQGEANVVLDEFRGGIDIAHLLRWLDRYPVRVEVKGGSRPLKAEKIWITSNVEPKWWYPDLDPLTLEALMRRLIVTEFQ